MARRLVLWVAEPKRVSVLSALAWALLAGAGVFTLAVEKPVAAALGEWLTLTWAILFAVGGVLGVVGALPGWWYVERAGVSLLVLGLAVIAGTTLREMAGHPAQMPIFLICCALASLSMARWTRIGAALLDPHRGPPHAVHRTG